MEGWRDGGMEGWGDGRDGRMEGWRVGGVEGWSPGKDGGGAPEARPPGELHRVVGGGGDGEVGGGVGAAGEPEGHLLLHLAPLVGRQAEVGAEARLLHPPKVQLTLPRQRVHLWRRVEEGGGAGGVGGRRRRGSTWCCSTVAPAPRWWSLPPARRQVKVTLGAARARHRRLPWLPGEAAAFTRDGSARMEGRSGGEEEEEEEEEEEKEEKEKEDKDNEAVMLTVDQQIDGPLHLQGPDGRHPVVRHTLKPPRVLPEN